VTLSYSALDSDFHTGMFSGFPRRNEMDTKNAVLDTTSAPPG
jgi:hypothetical protein